eukprot:366476-Chlamydomonas_euryale.AAC.4
MDPWLSQRGGTEQSAERSVSCRIRCPDPLAWDCVHAGACCVHAQWVHGRGVRWPFHYAIMYVLVRSGVKALQAGGGGNTGGAAAGSSADGGDVRSGSESGAERSGAGEHDRLIGAAARMEPPPLAPTQMVQGAARPTRGRMSPGRMSPGRMSPGRMSPVSGSSHIRAGTSSGRGGDGASSGGGNAREALHARVANRTARSHKDVSGTLAECLLIVALVLGYNYILATYGIDY